MMLPSSLTLPSGAKVALRSKKKPASPRARAAGTPLFSEVLALFDEGVVALGSGEVRDLTVPDFHVLRAVLIKAGYVEEEEVAFTCANCDAELRVCPCAKLEIAPYVDGELDDPELDHLDEVGVPREVPPIPLGKVRMTTTVTLTRRTVRQAQPFFAALAKPTLDVTAEVVTAMGVVAVGEITDAERIARALTECDELAWDAVAEVYLAANYPPRLAAVVFCRSCRARNDVDAPYEREIVPSALVERGSTRAVPDIDTFAERAHAIAAPLLATLPGQKVVLVIEEGTPAVDDGGVPLLGSYEPPVENVGAPPTVTVYYRTFCAIEEDEGPYDWEAELTETLEHELEHHVYWLRGDDPMDAAERAEIEREAVRVVGRREVARRTLGSFSASFRDFLARTWPLLLIAFVALLFALFTQR